MFCCHIDSLRRFSWMLVVLFKQLIAYTMHFNFVLLCLMALILFVYASDLSLFSAEPLLSKFLSADYFSSRFRKFSMPIGIFSCRSALERDCFDNF